MGLNYPKITEEEDQMRGVLEKGEYPFQVIEIEETLTKKGDHSMLVVEILVTHGERKLKIRDWIVLMTEMAWKLRHFAYALGLGEKYENNTLDVKDFLGKKGIVKLGTREYEQDGEKRISNSVVDYIKAKDNAPAPLKSDFIDDDISF